LWCSAEFAITCPATAEALKQLARRGDSQSNGESQMENRSDFSAAHAKADRVAQMFGDSAPPPVAGERLLDYRARVLAPFQKHSARFKDTSLTKIGDPTALGMVEDAIFADAAHAATRSGELRYITTPDGSGRPISRPIGSDGSCWDKFNPPVRYVRKFNLAGAPR
jgi:hypothetical protein